MLSYFNCRELDKITRDYAKAKVATGATATAAGAVGTAVAVVGACFGMPIFDNK